MPTYVERVRAMVDDLRTYPFVEVVRFEVFPPATADALAQVEEAIGARLAPALREFYGEANGLVLRWRIRQDLSDAERARLEDLSDDYEIGNPDTDENPFAHINLIPIHESIVTRHWTEIDIDVGKATVEFGGETHEHAEFRNRLKPFDLFSLYDCMAFLIERGQGNPKVLLLSDYYIEWDNSRITDFASYLEMLLATRGIVECRDRIYGDYRGDLKPPLVTGKDYWTTRRVPKLFRRRQ
jgi:SMI1 / KNR4 family (SUKH-1)